MTPRQAQVTIAGFLVLAVGVAVNALFLQTKPNTPAISSERPLARRGGDRLSRGVETSQAFRSGQHNPSAAPEERIYRFGQVVPPRARVEAVTEGLEEEGNTETVRAVQRELRQRGYGALPNDGIVRLPTRAAVMAYEYDNGLALTGQVSEALLARIVLGKAMGIDNSSAGKVRSAQAESVIRNVQQSLAARGYQVGPADGQLGEATVRAIREFEVDKGMVPKGRVSMEVVARLNAAPWAYQSRSDR
jgi:peptidoglycan hydrolase-like protein with peptidoglycan-binding domain